MTDVSPLRSERAAAGLSQGELAARAGVSRALVAAVEAGRHAPAVDAALRLATTLGTTVEALFAPPPSPGANVLFALGAAPADGARVRAGRVGGRTVIAPLPDHGVAGAGWARADGRWQGGQLDLLGPVPSGFVVAGCEPALGLAESMLAGSGERSVISLPASSGIALEALRRGGVHAAVLHGRQGRLPAPDFALSRLHLARWPVGLALPPRRGLRTVEDAIERRLAIVQREPAAASQAALLRALRRAGVRRRPAGPTAAGHLEVARTAALLGAGGVTTAAAADAFGLRFTSLEEHVVELWVADPWRSHPGCEALAELLGSRGFIRRLELMPGYDLGGCGEPVPAV